MAQRTTKLDQRPRGGRGPKAGADRSGREGMKIDNEQPLGHTAGP